MLPNILTAEQLSDKFLTPPYHQWLGLSLQTLNDDGVELSIRWRPEFVVNVDPGNTHGGILATLVDIAADCAIAAKLGKALPTVDMRVDFHRMAGRGDLLARGKIIRIGRTIVTAEAWVIDNAGHTVASGRALFLNS